MVPPSLPQGPTLRGRLVVVFSALIVLLVLVGASSVVALELSTRALQAGVTTLPPALADHLAAQRRTSLIVITAATVLAALVSVAVVVHTVRWFSAPLKELATGITRLQAGDVSVRLHPAGPHEVQLVGQAVNQLAEQTQAVRSLREASNRLRRGTMEGALAVREKLEWDDVMTSGLSAVAQTLDVDAAWFHPVTDDQVGLCTAQWSTPRFAATVELAAVTGQHRVTLPLADLRALWADGLVHVVTQASWVPGQLGLVDGGAESFGTGTLITVPMMAGEELMGALVLLHARGARPVTGEEVAALLVMAANLGAGLQNSRVFGAQRDLVTQLQDLDRQKTAFLSNVSHELRTPLTSITGYVEMLIDGDGGPLSPAMVPMLEAVQRNTTRLGLLIDDLLAISRIESDAYRITPTRVVVADLVGRAVETITPAVSSAGLSLQVAVDPGVEVVGDATALERCVLNLLSNAVKFTPSPGEVQVTVSAAPSQAASAHEPASRQEMIQIEVRDTGIGIPEADLASLFTRFFRASNAVEREIPGTGLGLAIVRGIVEHHGGRLEIDSQQGRGTSVTLVIPRAPAEPAGRIPAQRETTWDDFRPADGV